MCMLLGGQQGSSTYTAPHSPHTNGYGLEHKRDAKSSHLSPATSPSEGKTPSPRDNKSSPSERKDAAGRETKADGGFLASKQDSPASADSKYATDSKRTTHIQNGYVPPSHKSTATKNGGDEKDRESDGGSSD